MNNAVPWEVVHTLSVSKPRLRKGRIPEDPAEQNDFSRYISGLEDLFARVREETRGGVNA
jgi:hypothetical protein